MSESHNPATYAEAGVNLDLGDAASRLLYGSSRHTWEQRQGRLGEVIIPHDDFSGVRCIAVGALPPDTVMGSCRSNGYSLVRHILQRQHGDVWHTVPYGQSTLGALALQPARLYTAAVVDMLGGIAGEPQTEIHGVVHVTGGGLPGKLGRLLRRVNLGADITDPLPPGSLLSYLQAHGPVPDHEAYRVWNMGQGMLLMTPQPEAAIAVASSHGLTAQVIGVMTTQPGLRLHSRGYFHAEEPVLCYSA